MPLRSALLATCILASLASPAFADGKLSRARNEARGSSSSRSSDSSRSRSSDSSHHHHTRQHHHGDSDSPSFLGAIGCPLFWCYSSPSETSTTEVESVDLNERPLPTYSSYPYSTSRSPYVLDPELQVASTSASLDAHLRAEHTAGQPWAGQLSLDAGFLAGVGQSSLNMRVLMPGPFELSARNTLLFEPAHSDYSLFGAAALGLRVIQFRAAMVRVFAGFAYFGQIREMLPGAEVGLAMDVFVGRPWVLSASGSATFVGKVIAPQARLQLGYLFGRSEVFVAYQYLQIGSVDLSAPLLGTRLWL